MLGARPGPRRCAVLFCPLETRGGGKDSGPAADPGLAPYPGREPSPLPKPGPRHGERPVPEQATRRGRVFGPALRPGVRRGPRTRSRARQRRDRTAAAPSLGTPATRAGSGPSPRQAASPDCAPCAGRESLAPYALALKGTRFPDGERAGGPAAPDEGASRDQRHGNGRRAARSYGPRRNCLPGEETCILLKGGASEESSIAPRARPTKGPKHHPGAGSARRRELAPAAQTTPGVSSAMPSPRLSNLAAPDPGRDGPGGSLSLTHATAGEGPESIIDGGTPSGRRGT
jgi:hypothetical protein